MYSTRTEYEYEIEYIMKVNGDAPGASAAMAAATPAPEEVGHVLEQ